MIELRKTLEPYVSPIPTPAIDPVERRRRMEAQVANVERLAAEQGEPIVWPAGMSLEAKCIVIGCPLEDPRHVRPVAADRTRE